jgi:hypothetical protein
MRVTSIAERNRTYSDFERTRYIRTLEQAVERAQLVSTVEG